MIDCHVHLAALRTEDNGCYISPRMLRRSRTAVGEAPEPRFTGPSNQAGAIGSRLVVASVLIVAGGALIGVGR